MSTINTKSRETDYKDLDLDFFRKPGNKDISRKIGEEAVKRSIRNLILTNFYDRLFQPVIGSNVQKLLFENFTEVTAILISNAIKEVIANFEPRVEVLAVNVIPAPDDNAFTANIVFRVLNRTEPYVLDVFLERIR
jgi:phage baseplate assembly protein W